MMDRRKFVSALAGGLVVTRSRAEAQAACTESAFFWVRQASLWHRYSTRFSRGCAISDTSTAATSSSFNGTGTAEWSGCLISPLS